VVDIRLKRGKTTDRNKYWPMLERGTSEYKSAVLQLDVSYEYSHVCVSKHRKLQKYRPIRISNTVLPYIVDKVKVNLSL
jgi:hypothetical protein